MPKEKLYQTTDFPVFPDGTKLRTKIISYTAMYFDTEIFKSCVCEDINHLRKPPVFTSFVTFLMIVYFLTGYPDHSMAFQSILSRRFGLIIGCCMGFVVFIVLVLVLRYLKMSKQRQAVKSDQPALAEYLTYRHFSIQSGETGAHGAVVGHPPFITNSMNTTVLG